VRNSIRSHLQSASVFQATPEDVSISQKSLRIVVLSQVCMSVLLFFFSYQAHKYFLIKYFVQTSSLSFNSRVVNQADSRLYTESAVSCRFHFSSVYKYLLLLRVEAF
jgi:hypothetical protein